MREPKLLNTQMHGLLLDRDKVVPFDNIIEQAEKERHPCWMV